MTGNAAIEMLGREHKIILRVVLGLHGLARRLREGRPVEVSLLREAIEFMRVFADQCHHAKEEELLFPALVLHGVPLHGCPLDALLHEHKEGRRLVGQLGTAVDDLDANLAGASERIVQTIDAIERLYPDHIWKEDEMVFPMAARLIPEANQESLFVQFEEADARNVPGSHERFSEFATRLLAAIAPPPGP
jgi:hemerythrin-like domain-containing protein